MHPHAAAAGLSTLLVLAGLALSVADAPHARESEPTPAMHDHAPRAAAPAARPVGPSGTIPTLVDALTNLERRSRILIDSDAGFNPANGVRGGTGAPEDPFVISGWHVDVVLLRDTTAAYEIKENFIGDILILDWTGAHGLVHHNHVANLRTNRNVERVGDPTAALIENNLILRVEELRHFDGVLRNNTIGREPLLGVAPSLGPRVVLNIAGLNGAGIHDNLVWGGVDMKLHGHHHADAHGAHSHNHGQADAARADARAEDHQVRYIDFLFSGNVIRGNGFGLRYNDLDHAADDRTAASEREPDLEKPHVHHTRVTIADNVIEGATLRVAVLNAADERHLPGQSGELRLLRNRVAEPAAGDGIVVQDVTDARVLVEENRVERGDLQLAGASAILLQRFANVTLELRDNTLGAYKYGIRAREFDAGTAWSVVGNRAPDARYPVYWDETVAHPPSGEAGAQRHGHEHGQDGLLDVARLAETVRNARLIPARP